MPLFTCKPSPALHQAVEMLAHVVLNHVPVEGYCFRNKCVYMTHIVRRVLKTVIDRSLLDDKVSGFSPPSFPLSCAHTHTEGDVMNHINITHSPGLLREQAAGVSWVPDLPAVRRPFQALQHGSEAASGHGAIQAQQSHQLRRYQVHEG
jgi:hypothetical protein